MNDGDNLPSYSMAFTSKILQSSRHLLAEREIMRFWAISRGPTEVRGNLTYDTVQDQGQFGLH